jgi:AraC-like DNA-binding protein
MSTRRRRRQVCFEYPHAVKLLVYLLSEQSSRRLAARVLRIPVSTVYRWTTDLKRANEIPSTGMLEELVARCEALGFFYREPLRAHGFALAGLQLSAASLREPRAVAACAALAAIPVPARLREARELIDQFYFRAISCDQLAAGAQMSKFHFIKEFGDHFGVSPYKYLLQARVAHACRLFDLPFQSLQAIAAATGFNDVSSFIKAFRSVRGESVSSYMRSKRAALPERSFNSA